MANFDELVNGVTVFPGAMPGIFEKKFCEISGNNPDLTSEEVFECVCRSVGDLAARAEEIQADQVA